MLDARLYLAQRLSALIMVPLVLGHLAVMVFAVHGGLTAAEILERTRGSVFWFAFYGTFVLAVSVHAAIGMRSVVREWLSVTGVALSAITWGVGLVLVFLGARAVTAVTGL
ncbi:MAG: succinate dehydrogenase [Pseudomonadota bacterium]